MSRIAKSYCAVIAKALASRTLSASATTWWPSSATMSAIIIRINASSSTRKTESPSAISTPQSDYRDDHNSIAAKIHEFVRAPLITRARSDSTGSIQSSLVAQPHHLLNEDLLLLVIEARKQRLGG